MNIGTALCVQRLGGKKSPLLLNTHVLCIIRITLLQQTITDQP
jgi:hypothetical protein